MAKVKSTKNTDTTENVNPQVPNVEQLMNALNQLQNENKFLREKLNEASEQIKFMMSGEVHKKLEWLWKVITTSGTNDIFGNEFIDKCVGEFKEIMTVEEKSE